MTMPVVCDWDRRVFRAECGRAVASGSRLRRYHHGRGRVRTAFPKPCDEPQGLPPDPAGGFPRPAIAPSIDSAARPRDDRQRRPLLTPGSPRGRRSRRSASLIFTCCTARNHRAGRAHAPAAGGLTTARSRARSSRRRRRGAATGRAKGKIRDAAFRTDSGQAELPNRLRSVLAVVYLIFNEGIRPLWRRLVRDELCVERFDSDVCWRTPARQAGGSGPTGVDAARGFAPDCAPERDGALVNWPSGPEAWNHRLISRARRSCAAASAVTSRAVSDQAAINAVTATPSAFGD